MTIGKTQGYILTFRCVNCGECKVFATYPSENLVTEGETRARIYQVSCNSCGWRGDTCGFSAIHISHTIEPEDRIAGRAN
jgi:TPP-dependent indolepyruvate ferredoxin oxidoreductase alpha subunit